MTQRELLRAAKRVYVICLSNMSGGTQWDGVLNWFAVYVQIEDTVVVLKPSSEEDVLMCQVKKGGRYLPEWVFELSGGGFCKIDRIEDIVRKVNPSLEVRYLNGW